MNKYNNKVLLKIYLNEQKYTGSQALYEKIILTAKDLDLAGATATKGIMSFGRKKDLHTDKLLSLSDDLPIIIEIIEHRENIDKLLDLLKDDLKETLVLIQQINEVRWYPNK